MPSIRSTGTAAAPEERARRVCLDLLARRARSRADLAAALARRGVPPTIAEPVLDGLTRAGLVDDAAFARDWVEARQARRHLSRRALAEELQGRGVDPEQAVAAVDAVSDAAELATARALVRSRLPALASLPRQAAVRRLYGALARRGFTHGLALRLALEALPGGPDGEGEGAAGLPEVDDALQ